MEKIDSDSLSAILFEMEWSRNGIKHTDGYLAKNLNIWRDYLPGDIRETLMGKSSGQTLTFGLKPEDVVPSCEKGLVTEYFLSSGKFENIHTISKRGLKRPKDDKYYSQNPISDPVYCVYGSKQA